MKMIFRVFEIKSSDGGLLGDFDFPFKPEVGNTFFMFGLNYTIVNHGFFITEGDKEIQVSIDVISDWHRMNITDLQELKDTFQRKCEFESDERREEEKREAIREKWKEMDNKKWKEKEIVEE